MLQAQQVLSGDRQWCVDVGDSRDLLRTLPDESVQCVITSPPYWGLRDYGTAAWDGGDPECDHKGVVQASDKSTLAGYTSESVKIRTNTMPFKALCGRCGATRIDRQLGLEQSPAEYIEQMVSLFREVRRVLRADGTLWLNLGDSYAATRSYQVTDNKHIAVGNHMPSHVPDGLKPKDLVGIPWRVALALQADGWWLRSDIIWSKPNPMPESVTDRPTKAHEYIFLLTKAARYYYDADAVRLPDIAGHSSGNGFNGRQGGAVHMPMSGGNGTIEEWLPGSGANLRSVWTVATAPFSEAHFATFPPKLIEPCVKAGTSEKGQCPECGAPWAREVERVDSGKRQKMGDNWDTGDGAHGSYHRNGREKGELDKPVMIAKTLGWQPSCTHDTPPVPQVILDPFAGAGTTGLVATRMNRRFVGLELNEEYAIMARHRIYNDAPLLQGAWL